jgi:hypothetical protein
MLANAIAPMIRTNAAMPPNPKASFLLTVQRIATFSFITDSSIANIGRSCAGLEKKKEEEPQANAADFR